MTRSALLLAILGGALAGCAVATSSDAEGPTPVRLRVLSFNIHHGRGADAQIDLERIAAVIRSVEPDLVALQEVDRNTRRSGGVDQPAELARLTGLEAVFERNLAFQGGDYGNAILSRLPVRSHRNQLLPSSHDGEQRGALHVDVELAGAAALTFVATHLDYRPAPEERLASAEAIDAELAPLGDRPVVLAGDLNARPASPTITRFLSTWRSATHEATRPTYPAASPRRQIDFVLVRPPSRWRVVETRVLDEPEASDHLPIFAVLELVSDP